MKGAGNQKQKLSDFLLCLGLSLCSFPTFGCYFIQLVNFYLIKFHTYISWSHGNEKAFNKEENIILYLQGD